MKISACLACSAFPLIWGRGPSWCLRIGDNSQKNLLLFGWVSSPMDLITAKASAFSA